jgi:exodeoxyribonuclease V gamma subunit
MLTFHHGNDLGLLRELAVRRLAQSPPPPLEPEHVVVPNAGMAKWFRRGVLAHQGIAADLSCDSPVQFLRRIAGIVFGPPAHSGDPWSKDLLTVRLMGLIPGLLQNPGFAPLEAYLADTRDPCRLLGLARQIAALFDQYLVWRDDWILDWERGLPGKGEPAREHPWQPALWCVLSAAVTEAHPGALHPAAMIRQLCERLGHGAPIPGLPARVTGFGFGAIAPSVLGVFRALGAHSDVQIFQFNPCPEYWADIRSEASLARLRVMDSTQAMYAETGNPLLASWGQQGASQLAVQLQHDDDIDFHVTEPQADSLLARIQGDILCLREPVASGPVQHDGSIVFAETHSRLREVEALHDALLDMIERFKDLSPRDIVVMAPDIAPYAPHIEAVFGELSGDRRYIPYSLSDRSRLAEESLPRSFLHLFSLPQSRFTASEVLGLLAVPAVGERAGFTPADTETLHTLVARSGIRLGYDEAGATGESPALARNTWRFGLERLLLGVAMDEGALFEGVAPVGVSGAAEAELVGKLGLFVDRLAALAMELKGSRTSARWRVLIHRIFADFVAEGRAHAAARAEAFAEINAAIDALDAAGCEAELPREVVQDLIETRLAAAENNHAFLRAGVNVCQLMPLRSIPFRVVCLLGMNAEDFPRNRERPAFDLMGLLPRRGDPSRREDDRFVFLESLMAASDCLYISRIAADERSDARREPAVPVSELREYIDRLHGEDAAKSLTLKHALKPFDPSYFNRGGARYSFRGEWCPAASAIGSVRGPFCPQPLATRVDTVVRPEDLARFFSRPCESFFTERLDVRFPEVDASLEDIEPMELNALAKWKLRDELLEASLEAQATDIPAQALASGTLPQGAAGRWMLASALNEVSELRASVVDWDAPRSEHISLDLGTVRIEGSLAGLRGNAVRGYSVSGELSGRRRIGFWVRHLMACAAGLVHAPSELLARDDTCVIPALAVDDALEHLRELVALRTAGLSQPLPLFPDAAYALVSAKDPGAGRAAARKAFLPGFNNIPGEGDDAYVGRVFPDVDEALGAGFEVLAERVFRPLQDAVMTGDAT